MGQISTLLFVDISDVTLEFWCTYEVSLNLSGFCNPLAINMFNEFSKSGFEFLYLLLCSVVNCSIDIYTFLKYISIYMCQIRVATPLVAQLERLDFSFFSHTLAILVSQQIPSLIPFTNFGTC